MTQQQLLLEFIDKTAFLLNVLIWWNIALTVLLGIALFRSNR